MIDGLRSVAIAAGLVCGAMGIHRAAAANALDVCIDTANPTAVMDLRVARAVAQTQGYAVKRVDFVGTGKGDDGFPPSRFAKLAESECQLIMGFPVDVSNPNLPANVQATSAYASTGFVLVRRAHAKVAALGDLPNGSEVGIAQLDTYAGLLYSVHPNIVMHVYPEDSLMLADLAAKRIAAGVAWQPTIEFFESSHPKAAAISLQSLPEKHMVWNLVALYGASSQDAAALFNKGLSELQGDAKLEPLIAPYHPATSDVQRASVRWPHPRPAQRASVQWPPLHPRPRQLQYAVAWKTGGELMNVAATATATHKSSNAPPALYTEEQAAKGALSYYQNCAMCHGPNLDGQPGGYSGPALKGADFADPSYDFHVSDIFNFVAKQMPAATPGSLSHEVDVQIMAFILKQNGYPSGAKELVYEEAEKSKVRIRYYGK